ncbi:hypothetical protein ACHHYP_16727 [Achlya hypogyna]|uniref:Roadblock/LAMTOR2 domain-containing protein n=1 Tax=Achlya hypogyna TaxID=1202772 RepID=A0A1V9Y5W5_ACHHY|nr:hypothetical protein ACHHYP_16727 [Achlya hypogyna]
MACAFLCCAARRRKERQKSLLKAQLDRVHGVYPGTTYVCILDESGDVLAQVMTEPSCASMNPDELAGVITTLRQSVALFASTLNHAETQVVHIKGESHIFSCYSLDAHVLAFYSVMPSVDVALFDCSEADRKLEGICIELQRIATTTSI